MRNMQPAVPVIFGLFILAVGCAQGAVIENNGLTLEVDPKSTKIVFPDWTATVLISPPTATPIEKMVPYSKSSVWNTPIGSSPKYDVHSLEMISTLANSHHGQIITAGESYNYPVYFADEQTPRWEIPCTLNKCTIARSDQEIVRTEVVQNIPIPADAKPSEDNDARMIIIDRVTYTEYDLSKAERTASGWTAGTVSIYNIRWDGTPVKHSSRGSGIPSYAGLLRPWEIRQGRIEHALAFGYTEPADGKCVFPASKTDGDSLMRFAIPEGARLQLDPALTDKDFNRMELNRTGKMIARALQQYGMILVDNSGSLKIYVEDLTNNPFVDDDWTDPDLDLAKDTLYNIPHTAFRVLELPPGYWEPLTNPSYHGKCLTFPLVP